MAEFELITYLPDPKNDSLPKDEYNERILAARAIIDEARLVEDEAMIELMEEYITLLADENPYASSFNI